MNDMTRTITSLIFAILWAVTLFFLFSTAGSFFTRVDQQLKSQMVHDCSTDYIYQYKDETSGKTVTRPLEQQVRECIYQKDIKKDWTGVWSNPAL